MYVKCEQYEDIMLTFCGKFRPFIQQAHVGALLGAHNREFGTAEAKATLSCQVLTSNRPRGISHHVNPFVAARTWSRSIATGRPLLRPRIRNVKGKKVVIVLSMRLVDDFRSCVCRRVSAAAGSSDDGNLIEFEPRTERCIR